MNICLRQLQVEHILLPMLSYPKVWRSTHLSRLLCLLPEAQPLMQWLPLPLVHCPPDPLQPFLWVQ